MVYPHAFLLIRDHGRNQPHATGYATEYCVGIFLLLDLALFSNSVRVVYGFGVRGGDPRVARAYVRRGAEGGLLKREYG